MLQIFEFYLMTEVSCILYIISSIVVEKMINKVTWVHMKSGNNENISLNSDGEYE